MNKEFLIALDLLEKEKGKALIAKRLEMIPNEKVKELVREHLDDINEGRRDFRL